MSREPEAICGQLRWQAPSRFTCIDDGRNIAPLATQGRLVLALLMQRPGEWRSIREIAEAATWRGEIGSATPKAIATVIWKVRGAISGLAAIEYLRGSGYRVVARAGPSALTHQSLKEPLVGTWWRLRECRQHYRPWLSMAAFARTLGIAEGTLMRQELGWHQPRAETVRRFAKALGCSADELLGLAPVGGGPEEKRAAERRDDGPPDLRPGALHRHGGAP